MIRLALFLPMLCVVAGTVELFADEGDGFDDVASVFARHCVRCHNDVDREGDFSLQSQSAMADSGYVEPGDRSSHLLAVVTGSDGDPPSMPKGSGPLSADEVAVIERWIVGGARWTAGAKIDQPVGDFDWWAFRPPVRPQVPADDDPWVRTPIDAFVLEKSRAMGLSHRQQADRRTLIRRLSYDLIGLPPTPSEVQAFVDDQRPGAYERLVDRLLDSKHYGERWARHWLDVVKYADTCGYDKDKLRPNAWPYRDYVIRSFNEDKPYSRFVQEQIAGDVLYPGEPDGILGLGFIAAGPWDFIGHVEVPESKIDGKVARNLDRDEMVSNTLNTFCSVTIQCARCHHHKFDPFTQTDYYRLQAVFAAVDRAERVYDLDPEVRKRRRVLQAAITTARQQQSAIEKEIADDGGEELADMDRQIESLSKRVGVKKEPAFGYHSGIVSSPTTVKWVQLDLGRKTPISKIVLHPCHDEFNGIGAGFGFPARFYVTASAHDPGKSPTDAPTKSDRRVGDFTLQDFANPGLRPVEITTSETEARYVRVTATKLATRKNDFIFALAELEVLDDAGNNVARDATVTSLDSIEAPVRWSRRNLTDGKWARAADRSAANALSKVKQRRAEILARIETEDRKSRLQAAHRQLVEAEKELKSLPAGKLVYAAATDFKPQSNFKPTLGKPRPIHLLNRGNVTQPLQRLGPGLPPLTEDGSPPIEQDAGDGQRRAALARWLTDHDHPLVWRSIVNRVWQYHFGSGLVATPNDFGRMGSEPTHPELLDWLAVEFRDGGQSFKQLHRLIVTSSVYRQSSQFDPADAQIDGSNRYLWRMSRRRLEAEEIRDSILAVSGRLDPTMGGPGFFLFKLEKTAHSPHYEYHKFDPSDPASHRRSIYRFVVRSQPDPYMTTLDCADSSQSTPRRDETLTSLQALSLLNNRFNLEMAKHFAARLRSESDSLPEQVDRAMMLVTSRRPSDREREELIAYAKAHGLSNLCRMMFNLSEFVFLD